MSTLPEQFAEKLAKCDETDRAYAFDVRALVKGDSQHCAAAEAACKAILADVAASDTARFNALYGQLVLKWDYHDYEGYRELVREHAGKFRDHPYLSTFKAQSLASEGDSPAKLKQSLRHARAAVEDLPNSPGVLNLFAWLVARNEELVARPDIRALERAVGATEKAIEIDEDLSQESGKGRYTTYFATKAWLLALMREFDEALLQIARAIELEGAKGYGDQWAVQKYESIRLRILLHRETQKAQEGLIQALERFEGVRSEVVQVLALLAAVIAFLVTGVQATTSRPKISVEDALRFTAGLTGGIVVMFAAVSIVLQRELPTRRTRSRLVLPVAVVLFGLCLLAAARWLL